MVIGLKGILVTGITVIIVDCLKVIGMSNEAYPAKVVYSECNVVFHNTIRSSDRVPPPTQLDKTSVAGEH